MDVERIQKVNNLALDLMKQGLAADREEAIAKAEKIFKERDTEDYAEIRNRMEDSPQKTETPQNSETELSQDEIKNILQKNKEFIVRTFKAMQEKIDYFEREMTVLRGKVAAGTRVQEVATNETPKQEQTQQETLKPEQSEQKSNGESHPRSGNYAENDVSIEKFFYMGNK